MQYASINGLRSTAQPGLKGFCEHCGGLVQAKCGSIVLWHWAHLNLENCDSWHESETLWHRAWKDSFGKECSEISIIKDGVKHIADVLTRKNVVIELQNSPIKPETIAAREQFYDTMVWMINGTEFGTKFIINDKDFEQNWQVLIEERRSLYNKSKTTQLILTVNGQRIVYDSIREILTNLKFTHNLDYDIYSYHAKNTDDKFSVQNKLYASVLKLYRDSKLTKKFKPVLYSWNRPRKSWQGAKKPVFIDLGADGLIWITSNIGYSEGEGRLVSREQFLEKYNVIL